MGIRIVPYTKEWQSAARAFNERISAPPNKAPFLLPERAAGEREAALVQSTHYLAVDETGKCRGGILILEHPAWLNGEELPVINIQSPLSEGIVSPEYSMVGAQLIRFALKRNRKAFVIGMGGDLSSPLPRLLSVMEWKVRAVPFRFSMLHPRRCFRELQVFRRTTARRFVARVAAATGVAELGALLVQRGGAAKGSWRTPAPTGTFGRAWKDLSARCQFSVVRDERTAPLLYGASAPFKIYGSEDAWFSLLVAPMRNHHHFGNATVATLADCVGPTAVLADAVASAIREAKAAGADLLVANFTYQPLLDACKKAGMRSGPSNYLLATSKELSLGLADDRIYISRRDGDGLVNLVSNFAAE
jgi:hypothetical protein